MTFLTAKIDLSDSRVPKQIYIRESEMLKKRSFKDGAMVYHGYKKTAVFETVDQINQANDPETYTQSVESAGTEQGDATPITGYLNAVTGGPADGGVIIPDTNIAIIDNNNTEIVLVYPPIGEKFQFLDINEPFTLLPGQSGSFCKGEDSIAIVVNSYRAANSGGSGGGVTPQIIADDITSTSVRLYWSDVEASNYKLYQDGVEIYSGTALSYNVISGVSVGNDYDFRVVADGVSSSTINVEIPLFYNVTEYPAANSTGAVATRQTALEPSVGGADVAKSYSVWFRMDQAAIHDGSQFLMNVYSASAFQMAVLRNPGSDNTGIGELLQFSLVNGANNIGVRSSQKIITGKWYHLVVTYDGSELNTGMEIYLNGVLETVTRTSGGTYTGALNDAGNRFRFGNSSTATRLFQGNARDLCVWNKELNQTEVTELYNGGVPVSVPTVSFYGDVVSYYPMTANAQSAQNANYHLVTHASVTFNNLRNIDPNKTPLSVGRAQSGNTRYVAFSDSYYDSNDSKIKMYVRSGTSHLVAGRIQKLTYDPSNRSVVVVDPISIAANHASTAMIIDNGVTLFSENYDQPSNQFSDFKIYRSTDGLVGETFDGGQLVVADYPRFLFYGSPVIGNGFKVVPYYSFEADFSSCEVALLKSTDNFATYSQIKVVDSAVYYNESQMAYSRGRWIMLIRREPSPFGIYMSYSDDDCETWSAPVATNLGSGISNVSIAVNSVGNLNIAVMQRGTDFIKLSKNNDIDYVIANPTSFNTPVTIACTYRDDSYVPLGYPNLVHMGNEEYFLATCCEFSSSRVDMYVGHGKINVP